MDGGGGKLMGSEDEVVGCIGERKVKRHGEHRGWQYKWHLIFCMDSTIIFKRTNVLVKTISSLSL